MATIFDVLDNFLSVQHEDERDIKHLKGRKLLELGEEVRKYSASFSIAAPQGESCPLYIGGWPSANIWNLQVSSAAFTSMLYCGRVLAKDPISDWFSSEQYNIPRKLSSRPGTVIALSAKQPPAWNISQTRTFLLRVLPGLYRLRPLVEAGILVLAPSNALRAKHHTYIENVTSEYVTKLCPDPDVFTKDFNAVDLPVDDNIRGMFLFTGGNREEQIRKAVGSSVSYLLSEFLFAREMGFDFVAPYSFEEYFCRYGLDEKVGQTQSKVVEALLASSFPLYLGLTPETIVSIRDDNSFGEFRRELFSIYGQLGGISNRPDVQSFLKEAEAANLQPILDQVKREVDRGIFGKIGMSISPSILRMGGSILTAVMTQDLTHIILGAAAGELTGRIADRLQPHSNSNKSKTLSVWKKLYVNGTAPTSEMAQYVSPQKGQGISGKKLWGIPETPGKTVTVSPGSILADYLITNTSDANFDGSKSNPYGLCPCRSGAKYKFCCRDLGPVKF